MTYSKKTQRGADDAKEKLLRQEIDTMSSASEAVGNALAKYAEEIRVEDSPTIPRDRLIELVESLSGSMIDLAVSSKTASSMMATQRLPETALSYEMKTPTKVGVLQRGSATDLSGTQKLTPAELRRRKKDVSKGTSSTRSESVPGSKALGAAPEGTSEGTTSTPVPTPAETADTEELGSVTGGSVVNVFKRSPGSVAGSSSASAARRARIESRKASAAASTMGVPAALSITSVDKEKTLLASCLPVTSDCDNEEGADLLSSILASNDFKSQHGNAALLFARWALGKDANFDVVAGVKHPNGSYDMFGNAYQFCANFPDHTLKN